MNLKRGLQALRARARRHTNPCPHREQTATFEPGLSSPDYSRIRAAEIDRENCSHYAECLHNAAKRGWIRVPCGGCEGYEPTAILVPLTADSALGRLVREHEPRQPGHTKSEPED